MYLPMTSRDDTHGAGGMVSVLNDDKFEVLELSCSQGARVLRKYNLRPIARIFPALGR